MSSAVVGEIAVINRDSFKDTAPEVRRAVVESQLAQAEREQARGRWQTPKEIKRIIAQVEAEMQREMDAAHAEIEALEERVRRCDCARKLKAARLRLTTLQQSFEHRRARLQGYLAEAERGGATTAIPLLDRMRRFLAGS